MGIYSSKNKDKKSERIIPEKINMQIIIENINKRELNSASDFSMEKLKIKAVKLYEEAMTINNEEDKYLKLKDAVSYDNTNNKILKEYLKIEKLRNKKDGDDYINNYYYHISPECYEEIMGKKKGKSSVELLKEVFELFKNYSPENKDDLEVLNEKHKIVMYFWNKKERERSLFLNANSTFTLKSNFELALQEVYFILFLEINKKIKSLFKIINNNDLSLDEKLSKLVRKNDLNKAKEEIKSLNPNLEIFLLHKSNFFSKVLLYIRNYVKDLDEVIKKCLEFKNLESDFYVLLFIILEIKYMAFHESKAVFKEKVKEYISVDKYSIDDSTIQNYILQIKDIDKYNTKEIVNFLKNDTFFEGFNEFILNKYIKLEYFNSNNIIQSMRKFIEKFNERIANSKTITTALYEFYPELKTYKLFESEFTKNLLKNAIDTCYFFPFHGNKGAITLNNSGNILFFIPNKTQINEDKLYMTTETILYAIGNLGSFIYIEFHEIFGHHLRIILSKILEYNYISPRDPDSDKNESGKCFELLLFGKRILSFSITQILYLLDVNNYSKNFKEFRENFLNIQPKTLNPSEEFLEMLKDINLNIDQSLINNNGEISTLFKENSIFEGFTIPVPLLDNCIDKIELDDDED